MNKVKGSNIQTYFFLFLQIYYCNIFFELVFGIFKEKQQSFTVMRNSFWYFNFDLYITSNYPYSYLFSTISFADGEFSNG